MKQKCSIILATFLLTANLFGCQNNGEASTSTDSNAASSQAPSPIYLYTDSAKSQAYNDAITAYNRFLGEKIDAVDMATGEAVGINDTVSASGHNVIGSYLMFDVTKDGIPELHALSLYYRVFSYQNGQVVLLHASGHNHMNGPSKLLENGAILTKKARPDMNTPIPFSIPTERQASFIFLKLQSVTMYGNITLMTKSCQKKNITSCQKPREDSTQYENVTLRYEDGELRYVQGNLYDSHKYAAGSSYNGSYQAALDPSIATYPDAFP